MDLTLPLLPLDESLSRLKLFQSKYFGVVPDISDFLHYPDEPNLFQLGCKLCNFLPVLGKKSDGVYAGSYGMSSKDATARVIGEALERYAACYVGKRRVVYSAWKDLQEDAIHPAEFELFSDRQYQHPNFPYIRFDESTPTTWVEGYELPEMRPVLVPAQLVYLQTDLAEGERKIAYNTSTGIALGACPAQALLSGLCEVAERDAFVITWENSLSFPLVDITTSPELRDLFANYFDVPGVRLSVLDCSVFLGVPTAQVIARPENTDDVAFAVGAAAAATIQSAIVKATMELYQTRALAKILMFEGRDREYKKDFSEITSFDDHVLYSAQHKNREAVAFLDSSTEVKPVNTANDVATSDLKVGIETITRRLKQRGQRVYCVDITTPDLREAGLTASTVLSPKLARLSIGMGGRFLGCQRLYTEPHRLGFRPGPTSIEQLNKYPHPFP